MRCFQWNKHTGAIRSISRVQYLLLHLAGIPVDVRWQTSLDRGSRRPPAERSSQFPLSRTSPGKLPQEIYTVSLKMLSSISARQAPYQTTLLTAYFDLRRFQSKSVVAENSCRTLPRTCRTIRVIVYLQRKNTSAPDATRSLSNYIHVFHFPMHQAPGKSAD